jgi:alkylation response protein AidB-like acyl-CoA dehydrogenase
MDWVELATSLGQEFAERAGDIDQTGRFPIENVDRARATGYLGMPFSGTSSTGCGLETVCRAQTMLARGCGSTALALNMHLFAVGSYAEAVLDGDVADRGFLERIRRGGFIVGGSFSDSLVGDSSPTSVVAHPIQAGYLVSGRRPFCSLAPVLDLCFGSARIEGTDRIISFWLPRGTRGLDFENTWDTMAMRGTGSWDMVFDNVLVPHFFATERSPATWDKTSERARAWFVLTISSVYLGIAEAAVDFAFAHTRNRAPTSRPAAAGRTAGEIVVELHTARVLLSDALHRRRDGEMLNERDLALVKYSLVNHCIAAVDRCLDLVGSVGLMRRLPLERYYRDVRAGRMHPPNDERALEILGAREVGEDR